MFNRSRAHIREEMEMYEDTPNYTPTYPLSHTHEAITLWLGLLRGTSHKSTAIE